MKNKDYERFAKALALLCLDLDVEDLPKEKVELYFRMLKDLTIEEVEGAIFQIIKSQRSHKFPTIGMIRSVIDAADEDKINAAAFEAWQKAKAVSVALSYPSDDEMLEKTIKLAFGSWRSFGDSDPFHEISDRKHFIDCFRLLALQSTRGERYLERSSRELSGLLDEKSGK